MTRDRRQHEGFATQYKICDTTNITNITMKKFLSHIRTKDELTVYLSQKMIAHAKTVNMKCVVAWRSAVSATHCSMDYLCSTQEEADTKIILHSINAKDRGATKLFIFSQDTDVLVLALRRYERLPEESYFVPNASEQVSLKDLFYSIGSLKASALPGFHALSGCDTTGSLMGKGKLSYWKAFQSADEKMIKAIATLGTSETLSDYVIEEIEAFICKVYDTRTKTRLLSTLRWQMFSGRQVVGEKLPPSHGTLVPAIKRVNFQALIWSQDDQAHPVIPSPIDHGWCLKDEQLIPVMCETPCAPDIILQLIKCSCTKNRCSPPCKCFSTGLPCTPMCACGADEDVCDNIHKHELDEEVDSDFSDEETDS